MGFARPHFKLAPSAHAHFKPAAGVGVSYTPPQVAAMYGLPSPQTKKKFVVAIVELGGAFNPADYDAAMVAWGIASPPKVTIIGTMTPDPQGADVEVMLDALVVAGIGGASVGEIRMYFVDNTEAAFLGGIKAAIADGCDAGSISWGQAEDQWANLQLFDDAFAVADKMSWWVAAGDNGARDGTGAIVADGPSICPHAGACGGTTLVGSGSTISDERVWNDGTKGGATGGAISKIFALPPWQKGLSAIVNQPHKAPPLTVPLAMRASCDVSGVADPRTGWVVYVGGQFVVGGTSAVAPLWAGAVARLGLSGFLLPRLYAKPSAARDVIPAHGHPPGNGGYRTGSGYDVPTGLGSPGSALVTV